jgi:hypothetical protein
MSLDAAHRSLFKNSHVREARVKLYLLDPPLEDGGDPVDFTTALFTDDDVPIFGGSDEHRQVCLVSPQHALLNPGESVTLYSGDSYDETAESPIPQGDMTWTKVSGDAIFSPSGHTCVVTPTGGENSEVIMRCAVPKAPGTIGGAATNYRDVRIAVSTNGWAKPVGSFSLRGSFNQRGWSCDSITVAGDSAEGLEQGKFLLIHLQTFYDGVETNIGGYKRPQNLCVMVVDRWDFEHDPQTGHKICRIRLINPAEWLNGFHTYIEDTNTGSTPDARQPIVFVDNAVGATPGWNFSRDHVTGTVATYAIATWSKVSKHFNITLFDDTRDVDRLNVDVAPLFDQLASPTESVLGVALCNFEGGLMFIPHPAIRADEWWGTPDPRWPSDDPLSAEYCNAKIQYTPDYHSSGKAWTRLTLKGYDANANPKEAIAGDETEWIRYQELGGYILIGDAAEEQWAQDYLDFLNRAWDVETTHFCIGNALNIGDFTYLHFEPDQVGQVEVDGLAYIDEIEHQIDTEKRMQVTRARWCKVTGQLAV